MTTHAQAKRIARILAHLALAGILCAQTGPLIRVSVKLVELDAVVTDTKGEAVTGLTVDDFDILEDGKPQTVSSAQWIAFERANAADVRANAATVSSARPLDRQQVRRTVAVVVDDLGLSAESLKRIREALRTYVRDSLKPGDLLAVLPTGRSLGALGQFTSDKRLLLAAIEQLRFNPNARTGATPAAIAMAPETRVMLGMRGMGRFDPLANPEPTRQRLFMDGTLGALGDVIRGLRGYPGRKSLVFFSESMFVNIDNRDLMQRLSDAANRSFVVIHAVDPRGTVDLGAHAADDTSDQRPRAVDAQVRGRRNAQFLSQNGMDHLARQTGGTLMAGGNDLTNLVTRAVDDAGGYYLLAYRPSEATFAPKQANKWHRLEVRVKRPGLAVRARGGFLGTPDPPPSATDSTAPVTLADALRSPFAASGIPVRLTGYHVEDPKDGSVVAALMHIDARHLRLEPDASGNFKGAVRLTAVALNAAGQLENQRSEAFDLTLKPDAVEQVKREGLVYTMYQPVKKPGGFQLRVGVEDRNSAKLGTATQYVEVPEVKNGQLLLSSMVVQSPAASTAGSPAVRQFAPRSSLVWGARILNAKRGPGGQPQLTHELVIYRDGQAVLKTPPETWSASQTDDPQRLPIGGMLEFGGGMGPGDYVLELIVRDNLQTDARRAVATQAIDFEVKAPAR